MVEHYKKWKEAYDVSNKLVNYMLDKKKNYFNIMHIADEPIDYNTITFLPKDIENTIKNTVNEYDRSLEFNIGDFTITFSYNTVNDNRIGDDDDYEYKATIVKVTKEEFINYLAKLFYYVPDAAIMNEVEYDEDGEPLGEDIFLTYKDLVTNPNYIKKSLPEWI